MATAVTPPDDAEPIAKVIYPDLKGKTALITGAGKSIGRECVQELVDQGCDIIAVSRTQADLDSLYKQFSDECRIITKSLDITDWQLVEEWFQTLPPVHFLVNNAAIVRAEHFLDISKENLDLVLNTNFSAQLHFGQLAAKNMIKNNIKGVIINMGSVASQKALTKSTTYCCSKAALQMLTKCMALELGEHGIRSVALCPTFVMTGMLLNQKTRQVQDFIENFMKRHPLGRMAESADVSRAVAFLLSDSSRMITGSGLFLDSGLLA